jgi:O-antigen/teichoic acid export membrane protein
MNTSGAEATADPDPERDLRGWLARRGSLAVADQAVASLTGFVTHVWLARVLSPEHYGLFAISQSVYALIVDGFGVVFAEPMMVLAPGRFAPQQASYLRTLVRVCGLFAVLLGALLVAGHALIARCDAGALADVLRALGLALPGMLLLHLARRICSARFRLRSALWIGLATLALTVLGLWAEQRFWQLTAARAYAALGSAAGLVAIVALFALDRGGEVTRERYREVLYEHGRWAMWGVPNVAARWFPINAYYVLLPLSSPGAVGLAAAAQLRVIMTLIMPMLQLQGALSSSLISSLARRGGAAAEGGAGRVLRFVAVAATLYTLAMALAGPLGVPALFGERYSVSWPELAWSGAALIASGVASVLRTTLLALEQPRRVLIATSTSALATLTIGVLAARAFGVPGALFGIAAASIVQAAAMSRALRASLRAH